MAQFGISECCKHVQLIRSVEGKDELVGNIS